MSILHALGCAFKLGAPPTSTIRVQIDDFGRSRRTSLGRAALHKGISSASSLRPPRGRATNVRQRSAPSGWFVTLMDSFYAASLAGGTPRSPAEWPSATSRRPRACASKPEHTALSRRTVSGAVAFDRR
jgi:hypothetical protein